MVRLEPGEVAPLVDVLRTRLQCALVSAKEVHLASAKEVQVSCGFMGWAVDIERLKSLFGSKDEAKLSALKSELEGGLKRLDQEFKDEIADGAPSAIRALEQLVRGEPLPKSYGFMYAYVVKEVVDRLGRFLDNSAFCPSGVEIGQSVDNALKEMGVKDVSLAALSCGSLPVQIPRPDDFPGYGHLTADRVRTALIELNANTYRGGDPDVAEAIDGLHGWLRDAAQDSRGIVSFFC